MRYVNVRDVELVVRPERLAVDDRRVGGARLVLAAPQRTAPTSSGDRDGVDRSARRRRRCVYLAPLGTRGRRVERAGDGFTLKESDVSASK